MYCIVDSVRSIQHIIISPDNVILDSLQFESDIIVQLLKTTSFNDRIHRSLSLSLI